MGRFYISTPIYYPSDRLHIGHSYTTVAADALSRYHRRIGDDTWFLTGTDEHGQKIERKAQDAGKEPKAYVDEIVASIKELWNALHISYDDFIRTTEHRHEAAVQYIFTRLHEQGDIYKSEYEGWYCTPCETFWLETRLQEGRLCPDCGRPVELTREESYKFRLSKYAGQLLDHIETHPEFIQPESRRNEMVSFIKQGLEDLSVSRTTVRWGIPVPFDPKHTIYVWIDALSNYITALGYGPVPGDLFRKFWPADLHLVGKEIMRFHTIIWPITLLALGVPLPKRVFGHGWLLFGNAGEKMSKSRGNVIDPHVLIERYGVDPVRYFLLREVPFGADGTYTEDALVLRTNVDLANDVGNLLSRTTAMIEKFAAGQVPAPSGAEDDGVLREVASDALHGLEAAMDNLLISDALASLWRVVGRANKYIDEQAPWALARDPQKASRLANVLYSLAESLRIIGVALTPFLVETPEKIWTQLGLDASLVRSLPWHEAVRWGGLPAGTVIHRGEPIFPRIELEKADEESAAGAAIPKATAGVGAVPAQAAVEKPVVPAAAEAAAAEGIALIDITDFQKVSLRVAKVIRAEPVPKTDKLLRLELDVAGEKRQIVSGIAQHYRPEEMVGRQIVIVTNLRPAKLRGVESFGMLLAASTPDGHLSLITPDKDMPSGSPVK